MSFFLVQRLRQGAQGDDAELLRKLGIEGTFDDVALSAALVAALAKDEIVSRHEWPPPDAVRDPVAETKPTALDPRSLIQVLCSGTLSERQRCAQRLVALARDGLDPADLRSIEDFLARTRDLDLGYELVLLRRALPGAIADEVRDEDALCRTLHARLDVAIRNYWDGQSGTEPVTALAPEELALVAVRLREAPDGLAAHVAALVEGADPSLDLAHRKNVIDAFRYAGDPRLVGALSAVLIAEPRELGRAAARALARIGGPRSRVALLRAYRHSLQPESRAAIAGAIGLLGSVEPSGRAWVLALLSSTDASTLKLALEAMVTLGLPEDVDRIAPLLDHAAPEVVLRAIRALGRTGDGRALLALRRVRDREGVRAAELAEAEQAIIARLELRGEAAPPPEAKHALSTGAREAITAVASERASAWSRARAWLDWMIARTWLALGLKERGLARLELAALRRPDWAAPLVTLSESYAADDTAHALSALRRAVERDRGWVERHAARLVARVFLRRADESAKNGRSEIARGLLEEVLALDLRRVPSSLRFELERRLGTLRGDGA